MTLGRLESVDLREYFRNEASDFTPWLAEPHNIDLLADEIGIGIQNVQTEASVGRFNVDILAEEENTGRKIIIENQFGDYGPRPSWSTDHLRLWIRG